MQRRNTNWVVLVLFSILLTITGSAWGNTVQFKDHSAIVQDKPELPQINKEEITGAERKMSADLIKLINDNLILPGQSKKEIQNQMMLLNQYRPARTLNGDGAGVTAGDLVYVYIYLKSNTATQIVDNYAYNVTDRDEQNHLAVAWVEVKNLKSLAALDAVRNIRTVIPPVLNTGSLTSEGDEIHRAIQARAQHGVDGSGIKVGIISDGVDHWRDALAKGDLSSNVTVLSNAQGGDEGTAMLEIVHDLAPGAQLYFHDYGANKLAFNQAIDRLIAAGCNVICDDVGWLDEPSFEDGIIARHVKYLLEHNNIIYLSSAGNDAREHHQSLYYNDGYNFHDKYLFADIPPGQSVRITLKWDDKCGASGNDYDLLLMNFNTRELLAASWAVQDGDDDPLEYIYFTNESSSIAEAVILIGNLNNAAAKNLEVLIDGEELLIYNNNISPVDAIFGHPAVPKVLAVGAINVPNPKLIADYSSQGPVTIKYPYAETRLKPDICGVAGGKVTGVGGFGSKTGDGYTRFYGTSASAPHVAAIAALTWSKAPTKTADEIRNILTSSAVDLGNSGIDSVYGYGRTDALNALNALPKSENAHIVRFAGNNRVETAGVIANHLFPGGTSTVIIAESRKMVDSMCGTLLAGVLNAPILLADKQTDLANYSVLKEQISGLSPDNVYLLGGADVVSDDLYNYLQNQGCTIKRIAGDDRFDTAVEIIKEANKHQNLGNVLYVANGRGITDANGMMQAAEGYALAPGADVAKNFNPVLLVDKNWSSAEKAARLNQLIAEAGLPALSECIILGDLDDVPQAVENVLKESYGDKVTRLTGSVYDVAANLSFDFTSANEALDVVLARGDLLADALTGGILAGKKNAPILFVETNSIPANVNDTLNEILFANSRAYVAGGTTAVSEAVSTSVNQIIANKN